ncbi:GNAT family N-acetyltransferase [Halobacteriales archaeon SW_10_68_16]|nr:MAG: GNAT family N-acetyltransferase [Halobacteriales archaeon SW_10_68_16]
MALEDETEGFPRPPATVTDDEGREIDIRRFDGGTDALLEMYRTLDPADRTQGIPPRGETRLVEWVETLTGEGRNVVAWHGDRAVGHAVLMPMEAGRWELAIFVHSDYQGAHVGTHLLEHLLGRGQAAGVERVWLSVERHNTVALSLYESFGFEQLAGRSEFKMERKL